MLALRSKGRRWQFLLGVNNWDAIPHLTLVALCPFCKTFRGVLTFSSTGGITLGTVMDAFSLASSET